MVKTEQAKKKPLPSPGRPFHTRSFMVERRAEGSLV
jgi:hypothetical protein